MVYEKIDRNRIALIHTAKTEVNMREDNYRIILKNTFNVDTCKDLTIPQFNKLMEIFKELGFKGKYLTFNQKKNIQKKSEALWGKEYETKLKELVMKQIGYDIPIGRLTVKEGQNIINALEKILEWKSKVKKR